MCLRTQRNGGCWWASWRRPLCMTGCPPCSPWTPELGVPGLCVPPETPSSPGQSLAQVQAQMQALQTGASPGSAGKRSALASDLPHEAQL
jgi:hypothetical protein